MSYEGMLNQTITVANTNNHDRYGRQTFGSSTNIKCRFEKKNQTRLLPNGETQVIHGIIFAQPTITINTDDKITFGSDTYKVVNKETVVVGNGSSHHLELEVVKWPQ
jgi:hypothetical protein